MPSWVTYGLVAIVTYYLVTIIQTFLHRAVAHWRRGGIVFLNHVTVRCTENQGFPYPRSRPLKTPRRRLSPSGGSTKLVWELQKF